jgi:hypothetical protein
VAIAAGEYHSMGLKSDGTIVVWGDNTYGQRNVPYPNIGFTAIAAGGSRCMAIGNMCDTIADIRLAEDNSPVRIDGATISAAWDNAFYVETDDRASGIRVEKSAHGLSDDNHRANIAGKLLTNSDGERYIQAIAATQAGMGSVAPLGMANKTLGDDGLNNIGLLVRTWGRIKEFEAIEQPTWFIIDDGSGVDVRCEVPSGVAVNRAWTYVSVTGISRLYLSGSDYARRICIRDSDDIYPLLTQHEQ